MSVSLLLTASLHLTHKINPRLTLHTSIRSAAITLTYKAAHQWVSGRRLPWQHIPSRAAAWSIWDVMLLNQLSLYPALVLVRHYMKTENGTIQTSSPHCLSWLVGCRGHLFFTKTLPYLNNMSLRKCTKMKLCQVLCYSAAILPSFISVCNEVLFDHLD